MDPQKALDTIDASIRAFTELEPAIKHDNPRMVEWRYKSYGLNWATSAKWQKRKAQSQLWQARRNLLMRNMVIERERAN